MVHDQTKIHKVLEGLNSPWGGAAHCYGSWEVKKHAILDDVLIVLVEKQSYCDDGIEFPYHPGWYDKENYFVIYRINKKKEYKEVVKSEYYKHADQESRHSYPSECFEEILNVNKTGKQVSITVKTKEGKSRVIPIILK